MQKIQTLQNIGQIQKKNHPVTFKPDSIVDGFGRRSLLQKIFAVRPPVGTVAYDERIEAGDNRSAQAGRAYDFDGSNDFVALPSGMNLGATGNTIRIKTYLKYDVNNRCFFAKGGASGGYMIIVTGTNQLQVQFKQSASISIWRTFTGSSTLVAGTTYLVDITFTTTTCTMTVNGVAETVTDSGVTGVYGDSALSSIIGARDNGASLNWDGTLFGMEIYVNGALKAFYKMDEQGGSSTLDCSGNEFHGIITNATLASFHATQNTYSYQNEIGFSNVKNYWKYTQEFSASNWTKNGGSITATSETDPLGGATADIFSEDNTTGNHRMFQHTSFVAGQIYTVSMYLKYIGRQYVSLQHAGAGISCVFDIQNGTAGTPSGGTPISYGIQSVGSGWYRIYITAMATSTSTQSSIIAGSSNSGGTLSYTGLNGQAFYVFGAQVELGSLSSYQRNFLLEAGNIIPRNEVSTTLDAFGYSLQFKGKVPFNASLKASSCIDFDGTNDYVATSMNSEMNLSGNTLRVKGYFIFDDLTNRTLFSKGGNSGGYLLYTSGSKLTLILRQSGSVSSYRVFTGSTTLIAGTTYYVDIEFTTSTCTGTLNGLTETYSVGAPTGSYGDQSITFNIGVTLTSAFFFDGKIWGVELYKNGILQVNYPMAEGAGLIAYDVSGNNYHGTLTNGPTWTTQNSYHRNIIKGFEYYDDDATHTTIIRVPYKIDGTKITPTIASYSKIKDCDAGAYHNRAETQIDFTGGVASPEAVANSWETAWAFDTARVNPEFKRTLTKNSIIHRNDRCLAFSSSLSGSNLSKVQKYTSTKEV